MQWVQTSRALPQIAYAISQCSDGPEHACSFIRGFISLALAQNGRTYGIFFSQRSDENSYACSLARAFTALAHTQNWYIHGVLYQSMLKQTLAYVQPRQSLHCAHTCTKYDQEWVNESCSGSFWRADGM